MVKIRRRSRGRGAALVAGLLSLGACGLLDPDDVTRRTYEVAPHRAVCTGLWYWLCLRVRPPGTSEWSLMYETPRGFEFEWGVTKRIVVEERTIENPPADGSSIERTLVRVEVRTIDPADSLFTLIVPGEATTSPAPGLHTLDFAQESFRCAGGPDCDGLAAALAGPDAVEVTLVLGAAAADPFQVVAWRPCGSPWPTCGGGG